MPADCKPVVAMVVGMESNFIAWGISDDVWDIISCHKWGEVPESSG